MIVHDADLAEQLVHPPHVHLVAASRPTSSKRSRSKLVPYRSICGGPSVAHLCEEDRERIRFEAPSRIPRATIYRSYLS